jgi:excisionase family DNA binding protein
MNKTMTPNLVDIDKAAEHLSISKRKLYALTESRSVPHYRVGKRAVRFDLDELRKYFATQPADRVNG